MAANGHALVAQDLASENAALREELLRMQVMLMQVSVHRRHAALVAN